MNNSYSLSEICDFINKSLQLAMPSSFRVRAEISSINIKGGHCYMELVEKAEDNNIFSAKMRAVCWNNVWTMLSAYFTFQTGQTLTVGMKVMLEANINFHPVFGLSLQISGIDPDYTLGNLARKKRDTIEQLTKEGVIDMQKTLSIASLPHKIAVISSPDAAGYEDFSHQLRNSGYSFQTKLFTATMQGDKAADSIIQALNKIYDEIDNFDAVAIIRGGGASTDLSCFDIYELAFHITQFPLPVITGIGHQRDISVCDMVAFNSLKTPTATAEYFISFMQDAEEKLNRLIIRLNNTVDKHTIKQQQKINILQIRLQNIIANYIVKQQNLLTLAQKTITMLSPADIYKKGYSLVRKNGHIIKSANELKAGDVIQTQFAEGFVESTVNK